MADQTTNYNLTKPLETEFYDVNVQNENMDIIDKKLKDLDDHTKNKNNPHGVTKSHVGLSKVPNVSTNDQTPTYTQATSLKNIISGETLSISFGKLMKAIADLISHLGNRNNPHGVTKSQVGLSSVDNTSDANKPVSTAQKKALDTKLSLTGGVMAGAVDMNGNVLNGIRNPSGNTDALSWGFAQQKFSPSGNGYDGANLPSIIFNDDNDGSKFEAAIEKVLQTMPNDSVRQMIINDYPISGSGVAHVSTVFKHTSAWVSIFGASYDGTTLVKCKVNGKWEPWVMKGKDGIVAEGNSNGWHYRKWNSGFAECFKLVSYNFNNKTGKLGAFTTYEASDNYPFNFKTTPFVTANINVEGFVTPLWHSNEKTNMRVKLCTCLEYGSPSNSCGIHAHVVGFWK